MVKIEKYIKSPINYTGGKYKLLPKIIPLFPNNINTFVDVFGGGGNVFINSKAKNIVYNDIVNYVSDIINGIYNNTLENILDEIYAKIKHFELTNKNKNAFSMLRDYYNSENNDWFTLYLLISCSFNNQFRFNSNHKYNSSFGDRCFNDKTKENLVNFHRGLRQFNSVVTLGNDFREINFEHLVKSIDDFVYLDPPYLITTASYNDGKRGFNGWTEKDECDLLELLDELNNKGITFALSNVLTHKGKTNDILIKWCEDNEDKYIVHHLDHTYSNCNYHDKTGNGGKSDEVLICNYTL